MMKVYFFAGLCIFFTVFPMEKIDLSCFIREEYDPIQRMEKISKETSLFKIEEFDGFVIIEDDLAYNGVLETRRCYEKCDNHLLRFEELVKRDPIKSALFDCDFSSGTAALQRLTQGEEKQRERKKQRKRYSNRNVVRSAPMRIPASYLLRETHNK